MGIRKRTWTKPNGETGEAWVADYKANGKRHLKTFRTRKEAVAFSNKAGVEIQRGSPRCRQRFHHRCRSRRRLGQGGRAWARRQSAGGDGRRLRRITARTSKHHILPSNFRQGETQPS